MAGKVEASFILVSRLDYLHSGGRCSLAAALGANILHLRPCIDVKDGRMQAAKKYRGSFRRCAEAYAAERLAGREDIRRDRAFIACAEVPGPVLEAVRAAVGEYGNFRKCLRYRRAAPFPATAAPGRSAFSFSERDAASAVPIAF
jgi:hypothetical protein